MDEMIVSAALDVSGSIVFSPYSKTPLSVPSTIGATIDESVPFTIMTKDNESTDQSRASSTEISLSGT